MTTFGETPSSTTPTASTHAPYKLMRASQGRMLGGVAAGLAKSSGLDVTVVRICIGVSLFTGLGWVGYILLWIVLPQEQPSRGHGIEPAPENTARAIRIALVVAAALGVLDQFGGIWPFGYRNHTAFGFDGVLGLILLSVGVGVLFSRHRSDRHWWDAAPPPPNPVPAPSPTAVAPPAPAGDDLLAEAAAIEADKMRFVGPFHETATEVPTAVTGAVQGARDAGRPERRHGAVALGWARAVGWFVLLWWTAGVIGIVALWRYEAISIDVPVVLGVASWMALAATITTLIRERHASAVLTKLLVLTIPIMIGFATIHAEGPIGTRTLRPIAATDLNHTYKQAVGELELDLTGTYFPTKHATDINARVGAGGMVVTVPNDVALTVNARVRTGGYRILSKSTTAGVGQSETQRFAGCDGAPKLRLSLRTGAGWLKVKRANGRDAATCPTAQQAERP